MRIIWPFSCSPVKPSLSRFLSNCIYFLEMRRHLSSASLSWKTITGTSLSHWCLHCYSTSSRNFGLWERVCCVVCFGSNLHKSIYSKHWSADNAAQFTETIHGGLGVKQTNKISISNELFPGFHDHMLLRCMVFS